MAYQVLARKYRPLRFSDVVGQDHVTRTLLNAIAQNRIAHGYIFSGHRGIGKTTIARVLASALNCRNPIGSELRPSPEPCLVCDSCKEIRAGNSVDVIEIDAATHRGIDEIRDLRDAARYRPARDRFKIIILDEAHQITDAAFNALLKTLEEPPEHIVFMMATTQPEDIPQTIRSRCQHFSFHAVTLDDIVGQLRKIATDENIDVDDTTLGLLAEAGDGSMRDALSIMDQAIASAPHAPDGRPRVELTEVRSLMGAVSNVVFEEILTAVHSNDSAAVLHTLGALLDAGNGSQAIARQFVRFLRNCVVAKITALNPEAEARGIAAELLQISAEERRRAARAAQNFSEEELSRFLSILLRTFDDLGYRQEQRLHLELGLLKLVHVQRLVPVEEILSQLGATPPPPPRPAAPSSPQRPGAPPFAASPQKMGSSELQTPAAAAKPGAPGLASETRVSVPPSAPAPSTPVQTASLSPGAPGLASETWVSEPPTKPAQPPISEPAIAKIATPPGAPFVRAADERASRTSATPQDAQNQSDLLTPPGAPFIREADEGDPTSSQAEASIPNPTEPQAATATPDPITLQSAVVAALAATRGQSSASEQLEEATWTLNGDTLEIQTTLSQTVLPFVINPEAERILKATLRDHGAGRLQVKLLPGAPTATNGKPKPTRPAASGSAAELAEKHPLVQEAKRLFHAEISNVIDLRDKD